MGERLLHAVRNKDAPGVQALLVARADLEYQGRDVCRPTALAMQQGVPHGVLKLLLEARADVQAVDGQGRSLGHLWSWSLPKSKAGVREAQKKLSLLTRHQADLNAQLPKTGDTPLHILARVFNTLSIRASGDAAPALGDDCSAEDAEKYAKSTLLRIQLLATSAEVAKVNAAGVKPLDLIEQRFWQAMVPSSEGNRLDKSRKVLLEQSDTDGAADAECPEVDFVS